MTLYIILGAAVLLVLILISLYNGLVKRKNIAAEGWSMIDVYLKKRYDLIPNLVETVKGYANFESETFEKVVQARNQAIAANSVKDQEAAEKNLNQALVNLQAISEQYPDLKANHNFLNLQQQLQSIEGDIEKARRYYNGVVRENNTGMETFPGNVVAGMFGFTKREFFEMENTAERNLPQVEF